MSLLIKALDKAQAEKAQAKESADKSTAKGKQSTGQKAPDNSTKSVDGTLSLSPTEEDLASNTKPAKANDDLPTSLKGSAAETAQKEVSQQNKTEQATPPLSLERRPSPPSQTQAANVFTAKKVEPSHQTVKIALIIGFLALALLAGFAYWYQFVFNAPPIVIPPRPNIAQTIPEAMPDLDSQVELSAAPLTSEEVVSSAATVEPEVESSVAVTEQQEAPIDTKVFSEVKADVEKTLKPNETVVSDTDLTPVNKETADTGIPSENTAVEITQTKSESNVNPILMRAYEAYNAGNDQQAQEDYKHVLERYGANVDAMLGLGAIASRQGRLADANGWYQKVLEVDPRNEVANAGLLSLQQKNQPQINESQIKSLLASTPNDANLHAALGDLYASRGQWSAAQQAYFDAYRYNPSAENAFNLGVSLDQLGKANLALPYYQEALQKVDQSSLIDIATLEARISSIQ